MKKSQRIFKEAQEDYDNNVLKKKNEEGKLQYISGMKTIGSLLKKLFHER